VNSISLSRDKPETRRREVLPRAMRIVSFASLMVPQRSRCLPIMDVSGTIDAILGQKGREIFSVSPDATVFEAVEIMANKNVGALLVIKEGKLVGMISERDYTRKVMLRGKRSRETQVQEIMSSDLTIVTSREPVENCLRMMTDKRIRHLPVLDGETLRGIISIGDLVKWVIASQSAAIAHLENYISGGYSG
jgi:CBS domain-containing protein